MGGTMFGVSLVGTIREPRPMLTTARRSRLLLLLLLTVAPVAGFGAYHVARTGEREAVHGRFREYLAKQAASVEAEIGSSVEMLEYLAGLYRSSEFVTRREFSDFARPALARHPDIQAVEWAPRVTAQGREAHVARMRAEGVKGYAITHRGREGAALGRAPFPGAPSCHVCRRSRRRRAVAWLRPGVGRHLQRGAPAGDGNRSTAALGSRAPRPRDNLFGCAARHAADLPYGRHRHE